MTTSDLDTSAWTELSATGETVLRRGVDPGRGSSVLVRTAAIEDPPAAVVARLTHELAIARRLDASFAARPLAVETDREGRRRLVMSDPGGEPLEKRLGARMAIGPFLDAALAIAGALRRMHEAGVVHKDVTPANVLLDGDGRAVLTGFGHAIDSLREPHPPGSRDVIAGTFAYLAPEQTGRMNRSVDTRSDLYSFGVVCYRMLTGELPFQASAPLEWVHAHIAQAPIAPSERLASIPEVLSALVLKLLAKSPEERYQTAAGVEADLRRAAARFRETGNVALFPLATDDTSDRLVIPETLYGRERESERLAEAFERVVETGSPELVMVSGWSGIGKSSLVHELQTRMVARRAIFVSGKLEPYRRDVPFATLGQAFGGLVRQVVRGGEESIGAWRSAVAEAAGRNGQVLVDLIPELTWLIGPQPPVIELAPTEARNRFLSVFRRFLSACATAEHPLVLFLDDLQWTDPATLALLEHLATRRVVRHLLLIGSYRENEVGPTHPLALSLEAMRKGGTVVEIVLSPLTGADVARLVAGSIRSGEDEVRPLADLVHRKTGGNPFFAIQLLTSVAGDRLLRFDREARGWRFDLPAIEALGYSDNVVELMVAKLQRLPAATIETVKALACLGTQASLETLRLVEGRGADDVAADLAEAVRAELVTVAGDVYRFVHDRVHEAAASLIPEESLPARHLAIGRVLQSIAGDAADNRLFEIADHLNLGAALIADPAERRRLFLLDVAAGRRARASVAFAAARSYFENARALLPDGAWTSHYAETLALHLDLFECAFVTGGAEADALFGELLARAASDLDRASVLRLRMSLLQGVGRMEEALASGIEGLRLLGVELPDAPKELSAAFAAEQQAFVTSLEGRRIEQLDDLPVATDERARLLMSLLATAGACAYNAKPALSPLLYGKALNTALQHGNTEASCLSYISYGALSVSRGDVAAGFSFAELALRLNERFADHAQRGTLLYVQGAHINLWRRHLSTSLAILERGFAASQEVGNLVWANYNAASIVTMLVEIGTELPEVVRGARRYATFARESRNEAIHQWIRAAERLALSLMGATDSPSTLDGPDFREEESLAAVTRRKFYTGIANFHLTRLVALVFHGRFEEAEEAAARCAETVNALRSGPLEVTYRFFHGLCLASLHDAATPERKAEIREALQKSQKLFAAWAGGCPDSYQNRFALLSAELARIEGHDLEAMRLYDEAIRSAKENGFVQNEGLASELAARFYRARGFDRIAGEYLREARRAYRRWGASALTDRLDRDHPALFRERIEPRDGSAGTKVEHLDLRSVLEASQAVSSDIVLDRLIERLMQIALEQAGADRGLLILAEGSAQRVAAEAVAGRGGVAVTLKSAPAGSGEVPVSILRYVTRTRERVLVDDERGEHPFAADPYLRERRPRSVLALPLLKQGALVGVLYLENHLTPGAFNADRTTVLELLASQAAISLENATLYDELQREQTSIRELNASLEARVAERTRELESARDRADQASRSKSEFLANMSHEIRTPINAITGFTTLALRTGLPPRAEAYLGSIQAAAHGLLRIINDLLDFSKIEAGHLEMERIPFRIADVIASLTAYVDSLAGHKGLRFRALVDPGVPPWLLGDPLRLGQVLLNLCSNAVKFTERGEVEVRVGVDALTEAGARLAFSVRDTGIGLSREQAGRLFQAFSQADASTTRRFGGTGLGLVICQRLVGMMSGRIWLESAPGSGSTFRFLVELGVAEAVEDAPVAARPEETGLHGARVLLVEDNPINQQIARELLEHEGVEVRVAENGVVALKVLGDAGLDAFDAVLLDLQMPEMDGYEAARRIRLLPGSERLPLIAMTAHAMREERERCLAAGMRDHLAKPIDPAAMADTLARWIGPERLAEATRRAVRSPGPSRAGGAELPAELPGIDVAAGLRRCNGNARLYRELLLQFRGEYAAREVEELLGRGDREGARKRAHDLKGVAANLAMTELAAAAAGVDQALREGGTPAPAALTAALARVLRGLSTLEETEPAPAPAADANGAAGSPVEWEPLRGELVACLENGDLRAEKIVSALRTRAAGREPRWLADAALALESLDFDAALAALARD